MKAVFIILMMGITFVAQAGERLEGISGSMNDNSFLGWLGDKAEETEEEKPKIEDTDLLSSDNETQLASDDCVKEKVYTLDVENADQYERIEDFPFTYECVRQW